MKKSVILLFIVLIAMIMISCDGLRDAIAPEFEIRLHKNPPDGSEDKVVLINIKEGDKLPDAKKKFGWSFDNYKFDGWATEKGKKREKALDKSTLYAQWKPANE